MFDGKSIALDVLVQLPYGRPKSVKVVKDQNHREREAVIWVSIDRSSGNIRESAFCLNTGDYLGEDS